MPGDASDAVHMKGLRIWTGTWNVGNTPPGELGDWIPACGGEYDGEDDVIAVATQECEYKGAASGWFEAVRALLGPGYAVIAEKSLLGLRLLVAVRTELAPHVTNVRVAAHGTGLMHLFGNKGAGEFR